MELEEGFVGEGFESDEFERMKMHGNGLASPALNRVPDPSRASK
jgi:hypothetical protein